MVLVHNNENAYPIHFATVIAMQVKIYNSLPDDARSIREAVFMDEQGFQLEFDDVDDWATHLVLYHDNGRAIATCRVFRGEEKGSFILGRLAIVRAYRGRHLGTRMLQEAESFVRHAGGSAILLHAQCRATDFYAKSGYSAYGNIEDEEGCPHVWMHKELA